MTESQKNQPDIIILGLGPGDPELLTIKASRIINNAREIYLRTKEHPTVEALPDGLVIHSFDDIYEEEDSFDDVYLRISEKIINLAFNDFFQALLSQVSHAVNRPAAGIDFSMRIDIY